MNWALPKDTDSHTCTTAPLGGPECFPMFGRVWPYLLASFCSWIAIDDLIKYLMGYALCRLPLTIARCFKTADVAFAPLLNLWVPSDDLEAFGSTRNEVWGPGFGFSWFWVDVGPHF